MTRSLRPDIRNPLVSLPAARRISGLPREARQALYDLLTELAAVARGRADESWRRHKAPMAAYWKAVSVYAGHARRLCRPECASTRSQVSLSAQDAESLKATADLYQVEHATLAGAAAYLETAKLYYIQAPYTPVGNCVLWWSLGGHGYTCDLRKAWKVTLEEGRRICRESQDVLRSVSEIDAIAGQHVDFQDLPRNSGGRGRSLLEGAHADR